MEHWLRIRRKELDLTQEQLSAKLAIKGFAYTAGAVSHWETKRYPIPIDNADFRQALADILRLDESYLLSLEYGVKREHSPLAERGASLIDKMPEARQRAAVQMLETLLET